MKAKISTNCPRLFKPENWLAERQDIEAVRQNLLGSGCDDLIPRPTLEGSYRGAATAGERASARGLLLFNRQPGKGRAGWRARAAQSGLPTGAKVGQAAAGQEPSTEWRRSLTALSNVAGLFRTLKATPVRGLTASVEASEASQGYSPDDGAQRNHLPSFDY